MTNIFIKGQKFQLLYQCAIRCDCNLFSKSVKIQSTGSGVLLVLYTYFILTPSSYQLVIRLYKSPCIIFLVKGTLRQLTSYVVIEFIISFLAYYTCIFDHVTKLNETKKYLMNNHDSPTHN